MQSGVRAFIAKSAPSTPLPPLALTEFQITAAYSGAGNATECAEALLATFFERERALLAAAGGRRATYWEEVVKHGLPVRGGDIVQVWSDKAALELALKTEADIIVSWSSAYYLDCGYGNMFGANSWCDPYKTALEMYATDPFDGFGPHAGHRARCSDSHENVLQLYMGPMAPWCPPYRRNQLRALRFRAF